MTDRAGAEREGLRAAARAIWIESRHFEPTEDALDRSVFGRECFKIAGVVRAALVSVPAAGAEVKPTAEEMVKSWRRVAEKLEEEKRRLNAQVEGMRKSLLLIASDTAWSRYDFDSQAAQGTFTMPEWLARDKRNEPDASQDAPVDVREALEAARAYISDMLTPVQVGPFIGVTSSDHPGYELIGKIDGAIAALAPAPAGQQKEG